VARPPAVVSVPGRPHARVERAAHTQRLARSTRHVLAQARAIVTPHALLTLVHAETNVVAAGDNIDATVQALVTTSGDGRARLHAIRSHVTVQTVETALSRTAVQTLPVTN
jgi:hypothetical protein